MAHVQPVCSSGSVCKPKLLGRKTVRRNTIVQSLRCAQTRGTRVRSLCTICKAGSNSNGGSATAEEVLIVGAGIAGLSCGLRLRKAGIPFSILEASDGVGGRVRSDKVDGFILDRGFQIFLTSYPEAQAALDYTKLDLQPFYAGAMVQYKQKFHRVADPLRHPVDGVLSLFNDAGTVGDKVNVGAVRFKTLLGSLDRVLQRNETTTLDRLKAEGFSSAIIDRFFKPFLGGIFFDRDLQVTSRLFEFVMRMLATGQNSLPSQGIGAVADQLAAALPAGSIRTGVPVQAISSSDLDSPAEVTLEGGTKLTSRRGVVVATDQAQAEKLLGKALGNSPSKKGKARGTCNLYFKTSKTPPHGNVLYLNGEGSGLVNNACFPSAVAPSYAPPGQSEPPRAVMATAQCEGDHYKDIYATTVRSRKTCLSTGLAYALTSKQHLASVSIIGVQEGKSDEELASAVQQEMKQWFGSSQVADWQLLKVYRIPFAQPNQEPPTDLVRPVQLGGRLYVCGDHRDTATLDGAIKSGRRAAEALIADTVQESTSTNAPSQPAAVDQTELA